MDEGAGLAPGSMNGERVANGSLHQEAVQHRAVIAVVVEAIGEPRVTVCGIGVGSQTMPWCRSVMRTLSFLL